LLLLSCSNSFVPQAGQIRALEEKLKSQPCIADPRLWARTYWIDPQSQRTLRFSFGRPTDKWTKGVRVIPTRRWHRLMFYNDADWVADGAYDLRTGAVTVAFCGWNRTDRPAPSGSPGSALRR